MDHPDYVYIVYHPDYVHRELSEIRCIVDHPVMCILNYTNYEHRVDHPDYVCTTQYVYVYPDCASRGSSGLCDKVYHPDCACSGLSEKYA